MAVTRLSDVLEPDVWLEYFQLRSTELSALVASGIVVPDPQMAALLVGGGTLFQMPFFNDLANTEGNISSDNPGSSATPQNITTGQENAIRHMRNQVWGSADLLPSVIGPDPLMSIANRVVDYWLRQDQRSLISSLTGVFADNVANDSGDMVNDIYEDIATPLAANRISATAVLDTQQTMGDAGQVLSAISMHSLLLTELKKQNLITFIPNSEGVVNFPTFLGLAVVEDDQHPVVTGTNSDSYASYLYARGAVAQGEGSPKVPVEVEREALQGDGAGIETLSSRREFLLHPRGFSFLNASIAGSSPTNTELEAATEWNRVYDRKLIPMAELLSNS